MNIKIPYVHDLEGHIKADIDTKKPEGSERVIEFAEHLQILINNAYTDGYQTGFSAGYYKGYTDARHQDSDEKEGVLS